MSLKALPRPSIMAVSLLNCETLALTHPLTNAAHDSASTNVQARLQLNDIIPPQIPQNCRKYFVTIHTMWIAFYRRISWYGGGPHRTPVVRAAGASRSPKR